MSNRMSVAVYCRVAHDDGLALNAQIETMQVAAKRYMADALVQVFSDVGAAVEANTLPGFRQLMEGAERNEFSTIITASPSRIVRGSQAFAEFLERMDALGIAVEYAKTGSLPPLPLQAFWREVAVWHGQ